MRYRFHVALFAAAGVEACWNSTFEETLVRLEKLPRMFTELDGSFLWSPGGENSTRIEGVLYDRAGGMYYAAFHGECSREQFDQLLSAFGWPSEQFLFQLVREGVFVGEDQFRRLTCVSECGT